MLSAKYLIPSTIKYKKEKANTPYNVEWISAGPVLNSASYTDEETGEAYTMFAPIYSMRGDTITIWSWYYDEWNGNKYYNTSIRVVVY